MAQTIKQTYKCQWFQYSNGRYLKCDESFNSIAKCEANDIETAIEIFKEKENSDSEIPFLDRVNVWAEVSRTFYRVGYRHFGYSKEDYSTIEFAISRAEQRYKDSPTIYEITETGNTVVFHNLDIPTT